MAIFRQQSQSQERHVKLGCHAPSRTLVFPAASLNRGVFMREDVIRAVEAHLNGLGTRDISASPFHQDIEFVGPIGPPIKGASTVRTVFSGFFSTIKGININRHIVDGEWCATVFDFDTTYGTIPDRLLPRGRRANHVHSRVLRSAPDFGGDESGGSTTLILDFKHSPPSLLTQTGDFTNNRRSAINAVLQRGRVRPCPILSPCRR